MTYSPNLTPDMPEAPHSPDETQPVILAEADDDNARHVERQLRRAGVRNPVLTFKDGDDLQNYLVDAAQNEDPKPCVLLLNPRMPGANGYDPIRWAKRETCLSEMKVAIFSSTEHPDEVESASELGVYLFLKRHPDLSSLSPIFAYLRGEPFEAAPKSELPIASGK